MHSALSFYVTGQVSRQAAQPLCAMLTLLLASRSVPGLGFLGGWSPMQFASVKLAEALRRGYVASAKKNPLFK